ncbi:MAG: FecR domain-containing protein [Sphingomicrobium sp.]
MYKLALICVSFVGLIAQPASAAGAGDARWTVTQLSGDARIVHPGLQPASVHVRSELVPGDTMVTGPTGRATLVRGADYIVVAPRSEMQVPSAPQQSGFTRVIQNLGTLLFKVQHTGIPHFAVDTPMLAAVVKGTTFTVVVDHDRSAVQVIEGTVQVSAIDGGMSRMVEGGRTIFVDHRTPNVLLDADKPLPATSQPSSSSTVSVSAAGEAPLPAIATLTGGLVRADLTVPIVARDAEAAALPVAQNVANAVITAPAVTTGSAPTSTAAPVTPTTTVAQSTSPTVTVAPTDTAAPVAPITTIAASASPTVTAAATTVIANVTPTTTVAATGPNVTVAPTTLVAAVTTPTVSTPLLTAPSVTTPTITIGSNSGPGSMNSGPGSMNSGSGSTSIVSVSPVTTPTLTVPSVTAPVLSATTPTVTVPSVTVPTITVGSLLKL